MSHLAVNTSRVRCFRCKGEIETDPFVANVGEADRRFCSPACREAAVQIHALDLDDYYGYRERFAPEFDALSKDGMDCQGVIQGDHAERRMEFAAADREISTGRQVSLHVPDIRCAACTWLIESSLSKRDNVSRSRIVLADKSVTVDYEGEHPMEIVAFIESLGFTVLPDRGAAVRQTQASERKSMLARLGVAGIGMMQVMMYAIATYVAGDGGIEPAYEALMHWASLAVATPIVLFSALPFHAGALRDLRHFSPGMDVPVSLAITAAFSLSAYNTLSGSGEVYFDSVAMFTFLLLVGRFVELSSRQRYERSRLLADSLLPASALDAETGERIDIGCIVPGMVVRVVPGETITADGIVTSGSTSVNESAFTGESIPVDKREGSRVSAGTINLDGEIVVRADVRWDDFVLNRISALYREAASFRPRFSTASDLAARHFVVGILCLSGATGLYWYLAGGDWFRIALTVLVVSCPCALSLATPVAYTVALSTLRHVGVVVSVGRFLERLADVTRVVFDKTGTLTLGRLRVDTVNTPGGVSEARALDIAGALEQGSRHPIALAFSGGVGLTVTDRGIASGEGVTGLIDGREWRLGKPGFAVESSTPPPAPDDDGLWILLAAAGEPIAWFRLRDEVRGESRAVIEALGRSLQLSVLTGDASAEGERLARELGVEDVETGLDPTKKIEKVRAYQQRGDVVLMVGDGVNDAGSMSTADASLAVSPADIVVQEAADATLLTGNLWSIDALVRYSRRLRRIVRQNIVWAIAYNVSVIPLAVIGAISPWMAALGMSASSILVVLNANRLSGTREWR